MFSCSSTRVEAGGRETHHANRFGVEKLSKLITTQDSYSQQPHGSTVVLGQQVWTFAYLHSTRGILYLNMMRMFRACGIAHLATQLRSEYVRTLLQHQLNGGQHRSCL